MTDTGPAQPSTEPPAERPAAGHTGGLFGGMFARGGAAAAVTDTGWLRAMLDTEAALARAHARAGLVSAADAAAVERACRQTLAALDPGDLGRAAAATAGPVPPLVRAVRDRLASDDGAARAVHLGATSQDILDTAAMLVARRALEPVLADLAAVAAACAGLADEHRDTVMAGRTLLQQAVPTTFGLTAAGWLTSVDAARRRLEAVRDTRLAAQLGGAAGTLAALDGRGAAVPGLLAAELGLAEPVLPWHTDRTRIAELAGALGGAAGALGKIAADLTLLAQTEVGEVAEARPGGSSAMPHKRNPVAAVSAAACARRAPGPVATLLAAMPQEYERAAGAWQAEWEPLSELLRVTGSAAAWIRAALDGLSVDADRMRANLELTRGLVMAEHVVSVLGGGPYARDAVTAAVAEAAAKNLSLREVLIDNSTLGLTARQVDDTLDPQSYLGSARAFIERALAAHREGS